MPQELSLTCHSLHELPKVAEQLLEFAGDCKVILFNAQMGAGKTTLIKQICKTLGSTDSFSSPSFSIVNEYQAPGGKIYHFDLYRIQHTEELFDLGIEEYLDSGAYCLVEWPELLLQLIKTPFVNVSITTMENSRYFRAQKI